MQCCGANMNVPEIFQWKNPIQSGIALLAVELIYFGSLISGTGLLYLIGNYSFFFILFAFLFIKIKAFLDGLKKEDREPESKKDESDEYVFVSADTIKSYIYCIEQCTSDVTKKLQNVTEIHHLQDFLKLIAKWYIIAVLGQIFEFQTLVWLGLNWLFAFSFLLKNKHLMEKLHPTVTQATGSGKDIYKQILDKIPRYSYVQQ